MSDAYDDLFRRLNDAPLDTDVLGKADHSASDKAKHLLIACTRIFNICSGGTDHDLPAPDEQAPVEENIVISGDSLTALNASLAEVSAHFDQKTNTLTVKPSPPGLS